MSPWLIRGAIGIGTLALIGFSIGASLHLMERSGSLPLLTIGFLGLELALLGTAAASVQAGWSLIQQGSQISGRRVAMASAGLLGSLAAMTGTAGTHSFLLRSPGWPVLLQVGFWGLEAAFVPLLVVSALSVWRRSATNARLMAGASMIGSVAAMSGSAGLFFWLLRYPNAQLWVGIGVASGILAGLMVAASLDKQMRVVAGLGGLLVGVGLVVPLLFAMGSASHLSTSPSSEARGSAVLHVPDIPSAAPRTTHGTIPGDWTLYAPQNEEPTTFAAERSGPVVLSIWATWCGPCKRQMPGLEALHDSSVGGASVMLVSTESPDAVRDFLSTSNSSLPMYTADSLPPALAGTAIPRTYIAQPNGRVVFGHVGPAEWQADEVRRFLNTL